MCDQKRRTEHLRLLLSSDVLDKCAKEGFAWLPSQLRAMTKSHLSSYFERELERYDLGKPNRVIAVSYGYNATGYSPAGTGRARHDILEGSIQFAVGHYVAFGQGGTSRMETDKDNPPYAKRIVAKRMCRNAAKNCMDNPGKGVAFLRVSLHRIVAAA